MERPLQNVPHILSFVTSAKKRTFGSLLVLIAESEAPFAEGEGFKPPIPERGIPDFESSAIDHSANLPLKSVAKVIQISHSTK